MSETIFKNIDSMIQTLQYCRCTGIAGIQETEESSWLTHAASTDCMTRDILPTGTHKRHSWPIEEQRGTCHHEQEQDA